MSTQEQNLKAIADAIREKEGSTGSIKASELANRIKGLSTDSLPENICKIDIASNDSSMGTVTGGGYVGKGMKMTVRAKPMGGCIFKGWEENETTISPDLSYTFLVETDCHLTAHFEKRLPEGYTEVEYIECTYNQYIDTGLMITPTYPWKIVMDIEVNSTATSGAFFGGYIYGSPSNYFQAYKGEGYVSFAMYATSKKIETEVAGQRIKLVFDKTDRIGKVNDLETETFIAKEEAFGNNFKLYLLKRMYTNNSGSTTIGNSLLSKLYSCQIYSSSDVLFRDFVPCVSYLSSTIGEAGLYDLVGKKFYSSVSSLAFTRGPEV